MKVLIVEDDRYTREGLRDILEAEGYEVQVAATGTEGLMVYDAWQPDFMCLDIMMPGMNGYDLCREIRAKNDAIPVIFISAKSEEIDKVIGLEIGADDFIVKPFGVKEVVARIRAITRRYLKTTASANQSHSFEFGPYMIHPTQLIAEGNGKKVDLSLREIRILTTLKNHEGYVTTRDVLFKECWGMSSPGNTRTLDQHIAKLRKKIEADQQDPCLILTAHGMGYRYDG